jgi:hypothetical protein
MDQMHSKYKTYQFRQERLVAVSSWNKIHINLSISNMCNNFVDNLFPNKKIVFKCLQFKKGIYFDQFKYSLCEP